MPTIDDILKQISEDRDIKNTRVMIADLIEHHLVARKGALNYWEKEHFANAIAALGCNIMSRQQPTRAWLSLCVVNVQKALVPADQRNDHYTPVDKQLESLTEDQLIEEVCSLRQLEFIRR